MHTHHHSQFKTLIQHELDRLESLVSKNEIPSIYPQAFGEYTNTSRKSRLLKRPSTLHRFFSFAKVVAMFTF